MKKRLIVAIVAMAMVVGSLAGCGSAQVAEATEQTETVEEAASEVSEAAEAAEENVQMANPWVEITEEEAKEACTRLFKAPEGATDIEWMKCDELGDPDKFIGPLVQLSYTLDGMPFTARAQQGASEDTDIAGLYVEWTVRPEECTLANWGEGNMKGQMYRSINDTGFVDLMTWYDVEIGIAYSLSTAAEDLEGFDIQAIVEQMYNGEAAQGGMMYDDFVQQQAGKASFDSYDDVIAALTSGQGYAYIKLVGSDEEYLAVTDLVFEYDHSAYEASIYGKPEGIVKQLGLVRGNGSAYPLRLADGILYGGDNHEYDTYFISEYGTLMAKDSISDGINTGSNELIGFTREKNSFQDSTEFKGTQEDFEKLLADRENKPVIEFTVVE